MEEYIVLVETSYCGDSVRTRPVQVLASSEQEAEEKVLDGYDTDAPDVTAIAYLLVDLQRF